MLCAGASFHIQGQNEVDVCVNNTEISRSNWLNRDKLGRNKIFNKYPARKKKISLQDFPNVNAGVAALEIMINEVRNKQGSTWEESFVGTCCFTQSTCTVHCKKSQRNRQFVSCSLSSSRISSLLSFDFGCWRSLFRDIKKTCKDEFIASGAWTSPTQAKSDIRDSLTCIVMGSDDLALELYKESQSLLLFLLIKNICFLFLYFPCFLAPSGRRPRYLFR